MSRLIYVSLLAWFVLPAAAHAQNAADAYYDPVEMAKARANLKAENGAQWNSFVLGERFEYQSNDGDPLAIWAGQGWVGGDVRRLWFKTEGEYASAGNRVGDAEIQLLYSQAVSPFWELQAGLRQDFKPDPSRTYAVVGFQGLAPYWFEVEAFVYLSDDGDGSARLEASYETLLTQRLIVESEFETNVAFQDAPEFGLASGFNDVELGARMRYEFVREFAPYVGYSWSRLVGGTADLVREGGGEVGGGALVFGLHVWY